MKIELQPIAIAEFCGYVWYRSPQDKHHPEKKYRFLAHPAVQEYEGQVDIWKQRADGSETIITSLPWMKAQGVELPDYLGDLNAMHQAELALPEKLWEAYVENLKHVFNRANKMRDPRPFQMVTMKAGDRAEAFVRTIGKWEGE